VSRFFIERPVFSTVLAVFVVLAGALAIPSLPVSQYPNLAAPQVVVNALYVGASAETVETAVTAPLEQAINGVEGMRYIESSSTSDGVSSITVTFDRKRNLDLATVDVQNRVNSVLGRLPGQVRDLGVTVERTSTAIIMGVGLYSEDGSADNVFVSNYADRYIVDSLKRVKGVGTVRIFGERRYAMRVWLDAGAMADNQVTPEEVVAALRDQNLQVAAGQFGRAPAPPGQTFQFTVRADGRFSSLEEFRDAVVRIDTSGRLLRISDIAEVELGAESYTTNFRFSGRDAVGLGIFQLPGANALETFDLVSQELERLSADFPPGLSYDVAFNPTAIVAQSISEVLETLVLAIVLVSLVIFVFLQKLRTTLVPLVTIPVSLVGTFAFVYLFDFSINVLTLFAVTLAVGLVVDDAIVVIENIERNGAKPNEGETMRELAVRSMAELYGAIVATSLVVIAVFVPVSFFPGTTGILYQQFALTIAFAVSLSSVVALTLSPSMSALLLRPGAQRAPRGFGWFNDALARVTRLYERMLSPLARRAWVGLVLLGFCVGGSLYLNARLPSGFVPVEDQGYLITIVTMPPGTSLDETTRTVQAIEDEFLADPDVTAVFAPVGFSFAGTAPNQATLFTTLRPWDERPPAGQVIGRLQSKVAGARGALVLSFPPPPVRGLGNLGGFDFRLQDRGGTSLVALAQGTQQLAGAANADPALAGVFSQYDVRDPVVSLELDREKTRALGIPIASAYGAVQAYLGSQYVNDFTFANRSYRVYVQARPEDRDNPDDLDGFYLKSNRGDLIPLGTILTASKTSSPQNISHFNLFRSAQIQGNPAPGASSGQAIAAMERLAAELPRGFGFEWGGLTAEEKQAGGQVGLLFGLGAIMVFLVLAAQFESLSLPIVIMTAVPAAVLGAYSGVFARGLDNDVFGQVALLMLVGLAAKNSILITEFAKQLQDEGETDPARAAVRAASIRLRPILMTSLSFVFGTLPLLLATGAGSASRVSLGTAIFSGMLISTVLTLFLVPPFYVMVRRWKSRKAQTA